MSVPISKPLQPHVLGDEKESFKALIQSFPELFDNSVRRFAPKLSMGDFDCAIGAVAQTSLGNLDVEDVFRKRRGRMSFAIQFLLKIGDECFDEVDIEVETPGKFSNDRRTFQIHNPWDTIRVGKFIVELRGIYESIQFMKFAIGNGLRFG